MEIIVIILLGLALVWTVWRWQVTIRLRRDAEAQVLEFRETLTRQRAQLSGPDTAGIVGAVATDALLLADADHIIRYLNPAARALFEVPDTLGIGDSVIAITRHHELDDLIREGFGETDALVEQIEIRGRPFRAHLKRTGLAEGSYLAIALEDIGEVQRLARARRDMVANISHELRTPITSIRLLVDTLLGGAADTAEAKEAALKNIGAQADLLHALAQELLDLSMIESGRAEFKLRPVALKALIDSTVDDLSEIRKSKGLTIRDDLSPDMTVLADEAQAQRALRNLLHNAIKFSPEGRTIWINAETTGEMATISITDDGPGIHPDEQARIFERFYQSDISRKGGGTGLGLAIVKHIVQAHGGQVWVGDVMDEANRHGLRGAQIRLTLPMANPS